MARRQVVSRLGNPFLIFASAGRRASDTREHLYIVFNHNSQWSEVEPLRYADVIRESKS